MGCSGCRFIYGGCRACQAPSFKGKGPDKAWEDPAYQKALQALGAEDETEPVDENASSSVPAKKGKRAGACKM